MTNHPKTVEQLALQLLRQITSSPRGSRLTLNSYPNMAIATTALTLLVDSITEAHWHPRFDQIACFPDGTRVWLGNPSANFSKRDIARLNSRPGSIHIDPTGVRL